MVLKAVSTLESIFRANVSLAKKSTVMDYFVALMDLAKSCGNFFQAYYHIWVVDTPITPFRKS